jgi:hypothetical protein
LLDLHLFTLKFGEIEVKITLSTSTKSKIIISQSSRIIQASYLQGVIISEIASKFDF